MCDQHCSPKPKEVLLAYAGLLLLALIVAVAILGITHVAERKAQPPTQEVTCPSCGV